MVDKTWPKIIVIEDNFARGAAILREFVRLTGRRDFYWIRLVDNATDKIISEDDSPSKPSGRKLDLQPGINYEFIKQSKDAIVALTRRANGNVLIMYDLQLGEYKHPKITTACQELVAKNRRSTSSALHVFVHSTQDDLNVLTEIKRIDSELKSPYVSFSEFDFADSSVAIQVTAARTMNSAMDKWKTLARAKSLFHPLDKYIDHARNNKWFASKSNDLVQLEQGCLPHDLPPDNIDRGRTLHRSIVQELFPWMPDDWWKSETSALALNKSLSHLIGNATEKEERRTLVGSIFILASLACTVCEFDNSHFIKHKDVFLGAGCYAPVALNQEQADHERFIKWLFDLFVAIFTDDDGRSVINEVEMSHSSRIIRITRSMSAAGKLATKMRTYVDDLICSFSPNEEGHRKDAKRPLAGQTVYPLIPAVLSGLVCATGFGLCGSIYLHRKDLCIVGADEMLGRD